MILNSYQGLQNIEYSETGYVVPEFYNSFQGCKGLEKIRYRNDSKYLLDYYNLDCLYYIQSFQALEGLGDCQDLENIKGFEDRKYA
ncbi:21235_t:CDS:1, partial [Gigaspora margarita]